MKNKWIFAVLVLSIASWACDFGGGSQNTSPSSSSDLYVVVGNSVSSFTGTGSDGLILDKFADENNMNVFVQVANDRDIRAFREQMISGVAGAPDVLIVDDSLDADGLQNVKLIASHKVGVAIRTDVADAVGLSGNTISYQEFVDNLESGSLSVVASNALSGSASREFFFSTMAWCANIDAANLTADIVRQDYVQQCGTDVFNYLKSVTDSNTALDQVYAATVNGDLSASNSIIAFDSDLMGVNGLNTRLENAGKAPFKFFYFREATAQANVAIGTRSFGDDTQKLDAATKLVEVMISDASQEAINLDGFNEGSAALVRHNDSAFRAEWGVASNPNGVQIVNAPISAVAGNAMVIYRDYYKRPKFIKACVDVSPSMFNEHMTIMVGEREYTLTRTQVLLRALLKVTDQSWLAQKELTLGTKDVFEYYFFSTMTSGLVTSSYGADTKTANERLNYILGPWSDEDPTNWSRTQVEYNLASELNGFESNGTEMFTCASERLIEITANYDPNVDYIIVILTDGENGNQGINGDEFYAQWSNFYGKGNVSVVGIAFGTDGDSINKEYTAQFYGTTEKGNDDAGLVNAFKKILGN